MNNQCKVPNCANDWVFDILDHWCENHWLDWFLLPDGYEKPDWIPPKPDHKLFDDGWFAGVREAIREVYIYKHMSVDEILDVLDELLKHGGRD